MSFGKMVELLQRKDNGVNVNSFCSFLAKKYVGFWQRFIRGGIFPLFIVFLYLKMLLLNYQQMLLR